MFLKSVRKPSCVQKVLTRVKAEVSRLLFDRDMVESSLWPRLWVPWIHLLLFDPLGPVGNRGLREVALVQRSAVAARGLVRRVLLLREERQAGLGELPLEPGGRTQRRCEGLNSFFGINVCLFGEI